MANGKGTLSRTAELTRLYDFGTLGLVRDNKFITWGSTVFTNANGRSITKTVLEATPLLYKTICRQVVSGVKSVDFGNGKVWSVNFGEGVCDQLATVTDGQNTWVIRLRK